MKATIAQRITRIEKQYEWGTIDLPTLHRLVAPIRAELARMYASSPQRQRQWVKDRRMLAKQGGRTA